MIKKIAIIRQLSSGKYRLYSRKKDSHGQRRNLGTFDSRQAAEEHERDIAYFKHHSDDGQADDHETKMLKHLSDIGQYLEKAGYVDKAKDIYDTMCLIDPSLDDDEQNAIDLPSGNDIQMNTENMNYVGGDGTGGSYSLFSIPEAQFADDEPLPGQDTNDTDILAGAVGIRGNTLLDDPGASMGQGLSDSGFYQRYQSEPETWKG